MAFCGLGVLFVVVFGGGLRSTTVLTLAAEPPVDCGGAVRYSVSLTNGAGEGVGGAWVTVDADGRQVERLRTDQNGRFTSSITPPPESCDHAVSLLAAYEGGILHEQAATTSSVRIKRTTCADGTTVGHCTSRPSYYCSLNGTVVVDCVTCGCPAGLVCDDGSCLTEADRTAGLVWRLQQSVVKIEDTTAGVGGSGVIIAASDDQTVILTNHHVIADSDEPNDVIITTIDGKTASVESIRIAPDEMDHARRVGAQQTCGVQRTREVYGQGVATG